MDPKVIREMSLAYAAVYDQELREGFEYESYESQVDETAFEIFETVAYALISQGYSAIDVLEYFANVDEEVIIEDITNLSDGTLIIESVVSEQYILEQYEILNEALPALVSGAALAGRALLGAGARRAAGVIAKRMAGPGVRKALGSIGTKLGKAKNVVSGALGKVKNAATGALNKLPGGAQGKLARGLKSGAKWALGGAAFEAGSRGVKALMGDKDSSKKVKPEANKEKFNASAKLGGQTAFQAGGGAAAMKKDPKLTAADVQKKGNAALRASAGGDLKKGAALFKAKQEIMAGKKASTPAAPSGGSGGSSGSGGSGGSSSSKPAATSPTKPTPSGGGEKLTPMQQWAKANPTLASKVKQGQSGYDEISKMRDKPGPNEKQDQTPTQGSSTAKVDASSVESDLKAAQERDKKKKVNTESYIVLSHLLGEGYANTEDAAFVIMANMSEDWKQSILEMDDFSAGGGNAKMKKTGMTRDQVIALGKKNLAAKPASSPKPSSSTSSAPSQPSGRAVGSTPSDVARDRLASRQKYSDSVNQSIAAGVRGPGELLKKQAARKQSDDYDKWAASRPKPTGGYKGLAG